MLWLLLLKFRKLLDNLNNKLYYIVAGEASGDLHGSNLMSCIIKNTPYLSFRGVGGPLMSQRGLKSLVFFNNLAVIGFFEVIKNFGFFLKLKKKLISDILLCKPDKIILIDYPGFNLSLAKAIKKITNIPVFFYISPQVWAWKENRISIIKKYVDQLIVVFPFEKTWYKKRNLDVQYFGHPLIDLYKKHTFHKAKAFPLVVGLFPGSRKQEIKYHVPLLLKIIRLILKTNSNVQFIICLAPSINADEIKQLTQLDNVKIKPGCSWDVFNASSAAIVASGTATLECAISKTPFAVIYKTSLFNWLVANFILSVPFVSIVNILAKKLVVKEFLQYQALPEKIAEHTLKLLQHPKKTAVELSSVVNNLGGGRAYEQAAQYIGDY